ELFLATLAALEMLDGKPPKEFDQTPPGRYVLPLLTDGSLPDAVKAIALRLADPTDPALTLDLLTSLAQSDDETLKLEAIRTLALSQHSEAVPLLAEAAMQKSAFQRDAIIGLAHALQQETTRSTAKEKLIGLFRG